MAVRQETVEAARVGRQGRRPYAPATPFELLDLQRNGLVVAGLRELRPDLNEAVAEILTQS